MPVNYTRVGSLVEERVYAIREFHEATGQDRAELDLSGGVDSAVMLGLLSKALGPGKVSAVFLGINSTKDARDRARECAGAFGVNLIEFDGTAIFQEVVRELTNSMFKAGYSKEEIQLRCDMDPTILGSIRSTMRAPWGRAVNRLSGGGIRHGTGNEDEDRFLRFYQKGGDGEVDTNPIAMLSKGEVFQLARKLEVPRSILSARPSPDLWGVGETHNDESEISSYLGVPNCGFPMYSYIDIDTGFYENVGMIERFSRMCDYVGGALFETKRSDEDLKEFIHQIAGGSEIHQTNFLKGIPSNTWETFIYNAVKVERSTRHKANPNIPTLGSREELTKHGILTNELSEYIKGDSL